MLHHRGAEQTHPSARAKRPYGVLPNGAALDPNRTAEEVALLAYRCTWAGAFRALPTATRNALGLGKQRFYRTLRRLRERGDLDRAQGRGGDGRFAKATDRMNLEVPPVGYLIIERRMFERGWPAETVALWLFLSAHAPTFQFSSGNIGKRFGWGRDALRRWARPLREAGLLARSGYQPIRPSAHEPCANVTARGDLAAEGHRPRGKSPPTGNLRSKVTVCGEHLARNSMAQRPADRETADRETENGEAAYIDSRTTDAHELPIYLQRDSDEIIAPRAPRDISTEGNLDFQDAHAGRHGHVAHDDDDVHGRGHGDVDGADHFDLAAELRGRDHAQVLWRGLLTASGLQPLIGMIGDHGRDAVMEVVTDALWRATIDGERRGRIRSWKYFAKGLEAEAHRAEMGHAGLRPGDVLGEWRNRPVDNDAAAVLWASADSFT